MTAIGTTFVPNDQEDAPAALRFERRQTDRWPMRTAATAFRIGGHDFGQSHDLKVLDYSYSGMGAISSSVIEPGTKVSLGFAAPGCLAKRGTVLRCTPCGEGYRVAIEFEARLAA